MWVLELNPMRGNTEDREAVALANTREELQAFLDREKVEPYFTEAESSFGFGMQKFHKVFRQGGPLEWFNPPSEIHDGCFINISTEDDWASNARERFRRLTLGIPRV